MISEIHNDGAPLYEQNVKLSNIIGCAYVGRFKKICFAFRCIRSHIPIQHTVCVSFLARLWFAYEIITFNLLLSLSYSHADDVKHSLKMVCVYGVRMCLGFDLGQLKRGSHKMF